MASCFVAQPAVPVSCATLAPSMNGTSSSSYGGSLFHCFTLTRAVRSVASMSSVGCGKQWKLGNSSGRMTSQEHVLPLWSLGDTKRGSSSLVLRAKRKSRGGGDVVQQGEDAEEELDEDMQAGLNEISTEVLKAMLSEDDREVAHVREKVEYLGKYLVQENQLDAARFMLILRGMLDHEVVPQKDDLKGPYKKAFDTIAAVIEDSGWVLKHEGADVGGVEMIDDELMPPVLNSQY
ncbi:unnamed protein product [Calypogeia fissa]